MIENIINEALANEDMSSFGQTSETPLDDVGLEPESDLTCAVGDNNEISRIMVLTDMTGQTQISVLCESCSQVIENDIETAVEHFGYKGRVAFAFLSKDMPEYDRMTTKIEEAEERGE